MQHYGLRQFGRTILTITGILLLVIFGTRAASQATSLTAVGGQPKHFVYPVSLTAPQLVALAAANPATSSPVFFSALDSANDQAATDTQPETPSATNNETAKVAAVTKNLEKDANELADQSKDNVQEANAQVSKVDMPKVQEYSPQTDVK
jgi:hypothetical protein